VIYIGTLGDEAFYSGIAKWVLELTGIKPFIKTPKGVEITERWRGNQRLVFVLNHNPTSKEITLNKSFKELLTNTRMSGSNRISPFEVWLLTES